MVFVRSLSDCSAPSLRCICSSSPSPPTVARLDSLTPPSPLLSRPNPHGLNCDLALMARSPALHFTSSHPSHALALALLLLFLRPASRPSTVYTYLLRFVLCLWSPHTTPHHTTPHHPMCIIGIDLCIRARLADAQSHLSLTLAPSPTQTITSTVTATAASPSLLSLSHPGYFCSLRRWCARDGNIAFSASFAYVHSHTVRTYTLSLTPLLVAPLLVGSCNNIQHTHTH